MGMTKIHYVAIAEIIQQEAVPEEHAFDDLNCNRESLTNGLANFFEKDNEKFDRERFLKACGVEE